MRTILALRIVQGIALAVFSCCTVAVLVDCIPPGQSARGFALFSLTMLLPYSIIPAVSESLIPLLGGEARLFAATTVLGIPSFIMIGLLASLCGRVPAHHADGRAHSPSSCAAYSTVSLNHGLWWPQ